MKNIITTVLVGVVLFSTNAWAGKEVNLFVSMTIVSSHVAPDGTVIVNNLSNQTYVEVSFGFITLFNWNNYDMKREIFNEHDFGVSLKLPEFKSLKPYVDFQYWGYPRTDVGYELTSTFGVKHSGLVDSHFKVTHQFGHKDLESGNRLWMEVAKNFPIGKIDITSKIQVAALDNFFGISGLAHITFGLNGKYQINKKVNLSGFLNHQKGFEMRTHWYGGIKVEYSF